MCKQIESQNNPQVEIQCDINKKINNAYDNKQQEKSFSDDKCSR